MACCRRPWPKPCTQVHHPTFLLANISTTQQAKTLSIRLLVLFPNPTAFPRYTACVHAADTELVRALHLVETRRLEPAWWADPAHAPANAGACAALPPTLTHPRVPMTVDTRRPHAITSPPLCCSAEGAQGFSEACALGVPAPLLHLTLPVGGLGTLLNVASAAAADRPPPGQAPVPVPMPATGMCLLPSRSVYISGALDLFGAALASDQRQEGQEGHEGQEEVGQVGQAGRTAEGGRGAGRGWDHVATVALSSLPLARHAPPGPPPPPPPGPAPDPFLFMRPFAAAAADTHNAHLGGTPSSLIGAGAGAGAENAQPPISTILFFRD